MERIQANLEFMKSIHPKLCRFFSYNLLPELLTNKLKLTGIPHDPHSQHDEQADDDDNDGVYYICTEPAYGPMILVVHQNPQMNGFTFSVLDLM